MAAPVPPAEMLVEVKRLMRETRKLIETSPMPFEGALTVQAREGEVHGAPRQNSHASDAGRPAPQRMAPPRLRAEEGAV